MSDDVGTDCGHWSQSRPTAPEGWASSRKLRSVSRRASVRSRWLMSAVSTGGHEGREAGLSESWPGRRGVVNECQEGGAGPRASP